MIADCHPRGLALLPGTPGVVGDHSQHTLGTSFLALNTGLPPALGSSIATATALRPLPPLGPLSSQIYRAAESDFHVLTRSLHFGKILVVANISVA